MYAVCENIYYTNQVVCFPLSSISGTGAVGRSVMNVKQFLESLIWWLAYEAGKPLSANAAKDCLGWARPSLANSAAEEGGVSSRTSSLGSPHFSDAPIPPLGHWGVSCWDLWVAQSSLASLLNPAPTHGIPVLAREESISLFSCGHFHLPDASPPLANFFF